MGQTRVWTEEALGEALAALPAETFTLQDMRTVAAQRTGLKAQPASGEGLKTALLSAARIEKTDTVDARGRGLYRRTSDVAQPVAAQG